MCVTTQHYSSIFFFTTFCKKKHFRVYWTKVRWYYLGSSLTSLLDPDRQLRGHIGKWYEITVSRLSVTVPQPEHDGFKQHLWVKLESCWHSVSHSVQTCSEITAWMAPCKYKELPLAAPLSHIPLQPEQLSPLLRPQLQTQRQETSLCRAPADSKLSLSYRSSSTCVRVFQHFYQHHNFTP